MRQHGIVSYRTVIALALLVAPAIAVRGTAAEAEQIYVLSNRSSADGSQAYAFQSIGSVAGAYRLAVPENGRHVLVLTRNGTVWSWGSNPDTPGAWAEVAGMDGITGIAAGALHSVALRQDGTVWTWGANQQGQLGSTDLTDRPAPGMVAGLSDISMVAAGSAFTLALRADGTVWAFGTNWNDIVPGEARRILSEPVQIEGLSGIQAIGVYRDRGYARDSQGRLWTWGTSGEQENSAVTELSGDQAAQLTARVLRQLGDNRAAALPAEWNAGMVRVADSAVEVARNGRQGQRYRFSGAAVDVDWGWAVVLITTTASSGGLGSDEQNALSAAARDAAALSAFTAAGGVGRQAAAATGTLSANETHGVWVTGGAACAVGNNLYGQLGDATAVDRRTPVRVFGMTTLSKVSAGTYHSLGLKTDGTVWAWGYGGNGQLGDGTTINKPTPVRAGASLTGVISIAAGDRHSVAVRNDGTVWGWGYNGYGQLGDGSTTQRNSPVQTILITGVTAVAAGDNFTLALKGDGTVWAWGYNGYGQLGDASTTNRTSPVQVTGLTGVIRIAAGANHSLALKADGTVWAWGYNGYGNLGDGSTTSRSSPVVVSGLTGAVDIAGGEYHSLAAKGDGTVWAWGYNGYGGLGNATTTNSTVPVQTLGFTNATAVGAGQYHSMALKGDGTVWGWGRNNEGQLGNGSTNDSVIPVATTPCAVPPNLPPVSASPWSARLSAKQSHSHGVKADGSLWGWGENDQGQIGDGTSAQRLSAVPANINGVTQVSTGWDHTLAVKTDRTVWAWGRNSNGQLGDGTTVAKPVPIRVQALIGIMATAAGQHHSLALKDDGTVWGWGYNGYGQLGDGSTTQRTTPVRAITLTGVIAIAAGQSFSLALKGDGTVWGWGYNGYGQLGDGTTTTRTSAVQVAGLTDVIAIAAGADHSLALRKDGTVWGWGYNSYGNLGDGSTSYRTTIVRASDLNGVIAIAAGDYHSLAVKGDGTVWAFGYNGYGGIGDGTTTNRTTPVQAVGITGALAVSAGGYHSVALKNDGAIWGWGRNIAGQLGTGGTTDSTVPVQGPTGFLPNPPRVALKFVPVTPCRIADTRNPAGPFGGPAITGGTSRNFAVPASACGIPANAAAYSINATVVPRGLLGYLTVWPAGLPLPLASTLNSLDGRVKANAAIVPAGAGGAISVFATHTTDVILDVNGYFVEQSATALTFFPLPPCRVADTRSNTGPLGGPFMPANQERTVPVRTSSCNVPATAQAYSLNFTAVPRGSLGYITTWPTGGGRPVVSTLNAPTGQVTANAAVVPAGANGNVNVYTTNDTDLVIDINGYFAPAGAGGLSLYNLTPCRVLDTREPGGSLPFEGTQSTNVAASLCGVAANAQAYVFGATVVPPGLLGYLTLWPQGQTQPVVSTLNALDAAVTSNMAIVPTSNGGISSFASHATHLILDISGYFAP